VVSGSAVKKYQAAADQTCKDGRARGQFRFFGAHTGRWAGKGIQLQNLPRARFDDDDPDRDRELRDDALTRLRAGEGVSPFELKALIRPMLLGPLTVIDFAQIEARVIAWLAGEQWVLDAFAEGRDIYTETATAMGPQFDRQQGKTAVLACGFGGSVGALRRMGAVGTDKQLMPVVEGYREANSQIVRLWYDLWDRFLRGGRAGRVQFHIQGNDRFMELPSGRSIAYRGVHQQDRDWWFQGGRGRTKLWHGIIAENVTQAIARDILGAAILRVESELGPVIVGHVHDELILEGHHDVERVIKLMCDAPEWADGLPLDAEGKTVDRYQK
jgi:DNA polymerase